jgi:hypothetical protein
VDEKYRVRRVRDVYERCAVQFILVREGIERREGLSVREESLTLKPERVMAGEQDVLIVGIFVESWLVSGSVLEIVRPDERHIVGLLDVEWLTGQSSADTDQECCAYRYTDNEPSERQSPRHESPPRGGLGQEISS